MKASTNMSEPIPGYDFCSSASAVSPLSMEDLDKLEQTVGWSREDQLLLEKHVELFRSQAEAMVDSWRAVIARQPHLAQWFFGPDGKPDDEYKASVKRRFVQWVFDVVTRPHDRAWLNYQEEIGLRHTPDKKNKTDHRQTPPVVPLRYLLAFIPVVTDIRKFLLGRVANPQELNALEHAWQKAVHLHLTLWARPFTRDNLW
jgi:hypothetical protein